MRPATDADRVYRPLKPGTRLTDERGVSEPAEFPFSANGPWCLDNNDGFHCTRDKDHSDAHVAHGMDERQVATWPLEEAPE
jgi:hypothetical protein